MRGPAASSLKAIQSPEILLTAAIVLGEWPSARASPADGLRALETFKFLAARLGRAGYPAEPIAQAIGR